MKIIEDTSISNWAEVWKGAEPDITEEDTLCFICNAHDTLEHMDDVHDLTLNNLSPVNLTTSWIQKQRVLR